MMNKKETHWTGMLKYVLFVPLAMCVLFASNLQAQEKMNGEPVAEVELGKITMLQQPEKAPSKSKTQVVVIPAPKAKDMAEQMPVFPGGDKELMIYLANNLKYPESAIRDSIQGRVVCQFIVTKAGEITDVVIKRGLSPDIDAEALRVVKAMPKWVPGKDKGEPVDVYFTLPIRFQLTQYTSSRSDSPDRESGNNRRFIMTTGSASIEQ